MNHATRLVAATAMTVALCACRNAPPAQSGASSPAQQREAAYRANNRGVALMEQGSYAEAVRAFREALAADSRQRLARVNLPLALYYAGQLNEARQAVEEARREVPDTPQPLYTQGLVARAQNDPAGAADAFTRVLMLDASDIGAKVNLALVRFQQGRYQDVITLCRSVLAEEPYNTTAAYNLALALARAGDAAASAQAMRQFEQLRNAPYAVTYSQAYLEQGRYAEALASTGAEPDLVDANAPRIAFTDATRAMLDTLSARVVALADVDGDGRLDLLAGGESLQLFHNTGTQLVEARAAFGSAAPTNITGIIPADVNNDGRVDLLVLTASGPKLLVQQGDNRYADATPAVFSTVGRVPGAAALADVDHDGDLDFIGGGRLVRNNGNGTFTDATRVARLELPATATAVLPLDFDNRRDIDLLVTAAHARQMLFRNLRTGTFENVAGSAGLPALPDVAAATMGDVNNDGFTDIFFGRAGTVAAWALSNGRGRFDVRDAPAATADTRAAQLLDYDNDGLIDLLIATRDGLHLFRNRGRDWQQVDEAVAATRHGASAPDVSPSLASGDLDGDGDLDLVISDGGTVRIWRNDGGNARHAVAVALAGRASNRNGIGAKVELRAGSAYGRIETAATTPAVMPANVLFGIGARTDADAVRVLWPSGILQTETPAARATRVTVAELDRKPSSCPFLYTWDGTKFTFVTDFMGGGEMGYLESPGVYNVPDPDEYVRISDEQLHERNGRYGLRITNELEEVLYLDYVKLMAVTHYSDVEVYPNEGMRLHPAPYRLFGVRNVRSLRAAADDAGHDLLPELAAEDRKFAGGFPLERVRGYAKPHAITMQLPADAARRGGRTVLLLTGWTDYAFSTDNVAASQSGLTLTTPLLQAREHDGRWRTVNDDVGIPVGRPQTLVLDVTDYAKQPLRLVTSMRVYWDRIAVADVDSGEMRPVPLAMAQANLHWRGFSAEGSPDGRQPFGYDYSRVSANSPWKMMPGRYTREGDVHELLQGMDDRFVISQPGDELTLSFDAAALPPLAPTMRRTFLLYASGYSKEMDLYSASPDVSWPIPFRGMRRYPYASPAAYPHDRDFDRFHTRHIARAIPALAAPLREP